MTPLEIGDYKRNWWPGDMVRLHSDLDVKGKEWCRKNLQRWEWSMTTFTNVYEHTFHFEKEENAVAFKTFFSEFAK